jgi:hypothetical protein
MNHRAAKECRRRGTWFSGAAGSRRLKECRTPDELRERHGPPDHIDRHETMEIWH